MKRRDLLAAAVAAPMLLRGQTHEQGIALLRKMQAALGGVERLVAVRDVDWTTAVKTWKASGAPGPNATRRIRWIRPNILRKDQRVGDVAVSYFFGGKGGWEIVPDLGLMELKGRELKFVRGEAGGFYPNKWLPDRDARLQVGYGGPGIIRITRDGSDFAKDLVVDPGSGLPLRISATSLSGTPATTYRRIRQRLEFIEWQTVEGIKWPHKLLNFHDDVKRAEITTSVIKINSGLDFSELSRKPGAEADKRVPLGATVPVTTRQHSSSRFGPGSRRGRGVPSSP